MIRRIALALALLAAFGAGSVTAYDPEPAFVDKLTACLVVREAIARGYDPARALPATLLICRKYVKGVPR
jgi:hypothetical protein